MLAWGSVAAVVLSVMVLALVGSALGWLATHHSRTTPLNLMPWAPQIEAFLENRGLRVNIGALEAYYDGAPVVRAEGLRVLGADGTMAIYVERAALKMANRRLLALALSPKVIEAQGVTLRLLRQPNGEVTIAGLHMNAPNTTRPRTGLVEWLDDLPYDRMWGMLKTVKIQDATVLLRDEAQHAEWVMENAKISITRFADSGERGALIGQVRRLDDTRTPRRTQRAPTPIMVTLERAYSADNVALEAKFGQLDAGVIADYLPPQLQNMLRGQGTMTLGSTFTRGNLLGVPWVTLRLRQAVLTLPDKAGFSKPIALPQVELTANYQPSPTDVLTIRNLAFTGPRGNLFVVSGTVVRATTLPQLDLGLFSPGGDVQAVTDFFPDKHPKMMKTHTWLRNRVRDAQYRNLVARVGLDVAKFPGCGDQCGRLDIDAAITGGQVAFMDELPPVTVQAGGHFWWRGQTFGVHAGKGLLSAQRVRDVRVSLDNIFSPSTTVVRIAGTMDGEVGDVMGVLNGIPNVKGKIPADITGAHRSAMALEVPLPHGISTTFAMTTLRVSGTLDNLSVAKLSALGDVPLLAPSATLRIYDDKTLRVTSARALIADAPLAVLWQMNLQPHVPTDMILNVSGSLAGAWIERMVGPERISATGLVDVAANMVRDPNGLWRFGAQGDAKAAQLFVGPFNFMKPTGDTLAFTTRGRVQPDTGLWHLDALQARGPQVDLLGHVQFNQRAPDNASIALSRMTLGRTQAALRWDKGVLDISGSALDLKGMDLFGNDDTPQRRNLRVTIDVQKLYVQQGLLGAVKASLNAREGRWDIERFEGVVDGTLAVSIRLMPIGGGKRKLTLNAADLGRTLASLGIYDKLRGGTLFGDIIYDTPSRGKGQLKLLDFQLINPPTLMKLLGLLSLEQLVAGTDSTKFNRATLPVRVDDGTWSLDNALLEGPSMSIRLNGSYLRDERVLNFDGTLAPAIPFNRLVTKIPLLGSILAGSQDGVVAADFKLKGQTSAPDVTVRPLSVLTPGLLKDLFRGGDTR